MRTIEERKRFNVLDCGRRFGKSLEGEDLAIEIALAGYPVGWFAPEYKYLDGVWTDLKRLLFRFTRSKNETKRTIELHTGGSIEMWSLERGDAGRSRKYARAIIDEAALVVDLARKWNEDIRPTLTDYRGDAWFMSTPKGRNDFYQLWTRGQDPLELEWASWQMPTSLNPFIDPSEIEAARKELPERVFLQEYMAEFLEDSSVFRRIKESATAKPQRYSNDEHDPDPRHEYIVGIDWGKFEDYSVFSVIDATIGEQCYIDRSNRIDYLVQLERLKDVCRRFNVVQVVAESNSQATTLELIRSAGLPLREFNTTNQSKQYIIENLMLGFEQGALKILDDPVQIHELQAFEATRTPSGLIKYAAPPGYHDDTVVALALAWDAARTPVGGSVRSYPKKLSHKNRKVGHRSRR